MRKNKCPLVSFSVLLLDHVKRHILLETFFHLILLPYCSISRMLISILLWKQRLSVGVQLEHTYRPRVNSVVTVFRLEPIPLWRVPHFAANVMHLCPQSFMQRQLPI